MKEKDLASIWIWVLTATVAAVVICMAILGAWSRGQRERISKLESAQSRKVHTNIRKAARVEHVKCCICGKIGHKADMYGSADYNHVIYSGYSTKYGEKFAHEQCLVDAGWTRKMEQTGWNKPEQKEDK